ncbi:MAG: hypothetical protein Q8N05_09990 [Bacteroidota bacterium]|nr:hypothetical protein [Bacteroidota bacterium]
MISRENALKILNQHIQNANMVRHCLASEAVLRALALKLNKDPDKKLASVKKISDELGF